MTLDLHLRGADLAPSTVNAEARTVEVIAATGARVRRQDARGEFFEILSMEPGAFDPQALVGAPVLDTHQRQSLDNIKGVVVSARLDGGQLVAVVKLDDAALWERVSAGTIRNVSIGYEVEAWTPGRDPETRARTMTATKWTPREVSFVPVPADPNAKTRKADPMPIAAPSAPPEGVPPAATTRAQTNGAIRTLAAELNLPASWSDAQIDAEATLEQARSSALDAIRSRAAPILPHNVQVGPSNDDPAVRAERMGEALYARLHPEHELSEPARQFANMGTIDLARLCLRSSGLSTHNLAPDTLFSRALSTSDFPFALGNFTNRELRAGYDAAPSGLRAAARQSTARDFRAKQKINVETNAPLERVGERGEFRFGSMVDAAESYKIDTFGKIIAISRQVLVNDDLGWTADMARRMGQDAAAFEAQTLVDLLISGSGAGPVMADTVRLFHANHANLAASGAALSVTSLGAARLAMRKQKSLSGQIISAEPRFLVVPAELETLAEQLIAQLTPTAVGDVNAFAGKLQLVVEPRLTSATRWYVVADPAQIEGLEYSYLAGAQGPQIETKAGFEIDGVMTKIRLDFGAGFVDHRGWYANPGA